MRICIGTAKGIVILDPGRGSTPLMVLADPSPVWCMAQDCANPGVIYAGANGNPHGRGAFARSEDGARTWVDISPAGAREEEIWALAASPHVSGQVFIGTSHGRLFRSDDRGRNFYELTAFLRVPGRDRWSFPPPPHIPHVRSISFDPRSPSVMYVGVEEGGVFRTGDGGQSFEALNSGIYSDVHTVAVDPLDSRRLYATTGRGFYLSENAGATWRHIKAGINRTYTVPLLVLGGNHNSIYTAAAAGPPPTWSGTSRGADAILFRSGDRGASFHPIGNGFRPQRGMLMRLRPVPDDSGEFFGVANDGTVTRGYENGEIAEPATIAEKLPPAYDLVTVP